MTFDCVVGNPPYQKIDGGYGSSAVPIYHHFIEKYPEVSKLTVLVTPSRWFVCGKGLNAFRKRMLSRTDIRSIDHYDDCTQFFLNTAIAGGISIIRIDTDYEGDTLFSSNGDIPVLRKLSKYDIFVTDKNATSIIDNVTSSDCYFLPEIYASPRFSGLETNDNRFVDEKINDDYIKCYVSQLKGFEKWVHKNDTKHQGGGFWKVITPCVSGGIYSGFGNIFIGSPNETYSKSYISFKCESEQEAINLKKYLSADFANFMLSLRKNTHHIFKNTLSWIPLLPMDREWNDKQIYEHFDLTEDEINQIEEFAGD